MPHKHNNRKVVTKKITGIIRINKNSTGFIDIDDGKSVVIPSREINGAIDRDKVEVTLLPPRHRPGEPMRGDAGSVTKIIKRNTTSVAGVVQKIGTGANTKYSVKPISKKHSFNVSIGSELPQYIRVGDAVRVEPSSWNANDAGTVPGIITEHHGERGLHENDMMTILGDALSNSAFSQSVLNEAKEFPEVDIGLALKDGREDFTNVTTMTIDPERAQDFDDALSIRLLENDLYEVGIHIADVSHYVKIGDPIDIEAYRRGTSIYLVDRCVPMLPERLSNDLCSLREGIPRLAMSAVVHITASGQIKKKYITKSIIKSDKRFTYDAVDKILNDKKGLYAEELQTLMNMANVLEKNRVGKGALIFNREELRFKLDPAGKPIEIVCEPSSPSHSLVENFMLLANEIVADKLSSRDGGKGKTAGMYRVHDNPTTTGLDEVILFAKSIGMRTPRKDANPREIIKSLAKSAHGTPMERIMSDMLIRAQAKAVYSEKNTGHFGLGIDSYCHFTSPIRRYPDLVVHRLLKYMLYETKPKHHDSTKNAKHHANNPEIINHKILHETALHSSDREERATEAERASVRYKQIEYLENKIGTTRTGMLANIGNRGSKIIDDETGALVMITGGKASPLAKGEVGGGAGGLTVGAKLPYQITSANRLEDILEGVFV